MAQLEYKTIPLQVDDLSKEKKTAVIAHATYDNIDRLGDISRAGMFTKSWNESKADILFLENHDPKRKPGKVIDVWEDKAQAYTHVKFGNYTLGNDMLEMIDMGVVTDASFGFKAIKAPMTTIKGRKVRELKEVYHGETTLVNGLVAVNPLSGVKLLNKAFTGDEMEVKALSDTEQSLLQVMINSGTDLLAKMVAASALMDKNSDLYTWIHYVISETSSQVASAKSQMRYGTKSFGELKAHIENAEKFCRNSNASDECIQNVMAEVKAAQEIISSFDTANTHEIYEPAASATGSVNESEIITRIKLLNAKLVLS